MIEYIKGNALNVGDNSLIIHGCNCMGVMGKGIAREIKNRYPHVFEAYRKTYESSSISKIVFKGWDGLVLGDIEIVQVENYEYKHKYICNANIQQKYGNSTRQVSYDAFVKCFEYIRLYVLYIEKEENVKLNVIFPKIGSGLGGGDWDIIACIIDKTLGDKITKICYTY